MVKFLRTDWMRYSRLGKNRKKLQKWRRARGRHNKIRRKRFGYPVMPTVGYISARKTSGLVNNKVPMLVHNMNELKQADKKSNIVILARVGAKKKMELIKAASEMGIEIQNIGGKK